MDYPSADGDPVRAWVVYPERSDPAPVVVVIHEIFGLTDWIRGVADQLAADGFIAIAPDLLSGYGPDGGGTESVGLYAEDDARVNVTIDPALQELTRLGRSFEVEMYEGAGHGFLRQQDGRDGANLQASRQAWPRTLSFLRTHLEGR